MSLVASVYHPDAIRGQHDVSPSVRNARFRAITHAYSVLRGRRSTSSHGGVGTWDYYESRDEAMRAELRRRSRRSGSASSSTTTADDSVRHENIDDDQLRYTFMALAIAAVIVAMGSVSTHLDNVERHSRSAAANLVQARADAQVDGMERRRNIRERVRAMRDAEAREMVNGSTTPEMHDTSKLWQGEPPPAETGTENVSKDERI
ncbi:hypothetical protein J3R82DRAFT_2700 [Butyriboletus roseoflavus]|nr:hypothetical protein J3R82DRAFT_2700 [Butyriboletus roseoflavus]